MEKILYNSGATEAVSLATVQVLLAAILATLTASVEAQREILQAVLGIQIGDDVIGKTMHRYQQKMTVLNGGAV